MSIVSDSQKLSILVNWLGAHSLLSDGKEQKFCSDMAADLRRIASDLEKREAPSDEEIVQWANDIDYAKLGITATEALQMIRGRIAGAKYMRYKLTGK